MEKELKCYVLKKKKTFKAQQVSSTPYEKQKGLENCTRHRFPHADKSNNYNKKRLLLAGPAKNNFHLGEVKASAIHHQRSAHFSQRVATKPLLSFLPFSPQWILLQKHIRSYICLPGFSCVSCGLKPFLVVLKKCLKWTLQTTRVCSFSSKD